MPDPPNFKVTLDRTDEIGDALRKLADTKVMVGIPDDNERKDTNGSNARTDKSGMTNAALGYLHETGSPAQGIPPRPWLVPGVSNSQTQWEPYLKQAATLALDGKIDAIDRALHAAGLTAVSAVKNRITAGIPPPLAQSTVDARRRRTGRKALTASDTTPLVQTAQLLNSISYIIRKGK